MHNMIFFLFGLIGAIAGSTLSAWVWRIRSESSMLSGRSKCPICGHILGFLDLIPIVNFVLRRGKCAYCHKAISLWYPLTEISLAILYALLYTYFGFTMIFLRAVVLVFFLAAIFIYDARYMEVPDRFSLTAVMLMLIIAPRPFADAALGMLFCGGFFALQYAISGGRWIGGGDIRIGLLMGAALGWQTGLFGLFLAYMLGGLYGVYAISQKKVTRSTAIPFGTFLTVATLVAFVFGLPVVEWYKSMII
jgi:prepilin signal peptidase PulO-like enzyme (type II secretory pathway)